MVLGDLIARFRDEAVASETLLSLGDLALTARVVACAAQSNTSTGQLAAQAVRRFADSASDDEWATLLGRLSRADDPGRAFLRHVLSRAVPA